MPQDTAQELTTDPTETSPEEEPRKQPRKVDDDTTMGETGVGTDDTNTDPDMPPPGGGGGGGASSSR